MISYWERESFMKFDVIVIGSGIVGLSAAFSIKERFPEYKILILERGIFPSGASTKNAGFTTFGGVGEILNDLVLMGENDLLNLVEMRCKGLELLRSRLGDANIDYEQNGGFELQGAEDYIDNDSVNYVNKLLYPIFRQEVFTRDDTYINRFGFNTDHIKSCIFTSLEGQIDTGLMMRNYLKLNLEIGNTIINGAEVGKIETDASEVQVAVIAMNLKGEILFRANQVVVCTNAFAKSFFPELEINPGRGQVLVTHPIEGLLPKGIFHFDNGYYYFRNINNRLLFGGGRNQDFEGESTTDFGPNEKILLNLHKHLKEWILPDCNYQVDMQWSGIMAFGSDKKPIIKRVNEKIIAGVRMNGIGVAIGSEVGRKIADLL